MEHGGAGKGLPTSKTVQFLVDIHASPYQRRCGKPCQCGSDLVIQFRTIATVADKLSDSHFYIYSSIVY